MFCSPVLFIVYSYPSHHAKLQTSLTHSSSSHSWEKTKSSTHLSIVLANCSRWSLVTRGRLRSGLTMSSLSQLLMWVKLCLFKMKMTSAKVSTTVRGAAPPIACRSRRSNQNHRVWVITKLFREKRWFWEQLGFGILLFLHCPRPGPNSTRFLLNASRIPQCFNPPLPQRLDGYSSVYGHSLRADRGSAIQECRNETGCQIV